MRNLHLLVRYPSLNHDGATNIPLPRSNVDLSHQIAYGDAAAAALEVCTKPINKMNALVCYYPTHFPPPKMGFPPNLKILLHLALDTPNPSFHFRTFSYPHAMAGFAEAGSSRYEKISSNLSWSRTLEAVREGFDIKPDLEAIWDNHLARKLPKLRSHVANN